MGRLFKYLVIIYSILILLMIISYSFGALYNNYVKTHIPEQKYDSEGRPMTAEQPKDTFSYYIFVWTRSFIFYGFPFFIIFMSALYLFKEKEGYLKSLLIPISYLVTGIILTTIWLFNFSSGEEGMVVIYIVPQLFITLILASIINGLILFFIKK